MVIGNTVPVFVMTNRCTLQIAVLLCFSTIAFALNYRMLQSQQRSSNQACQDLLMQLNGTPHYCLDDRMDFKVPEEIKQPQEYSKEDTVMVIHKMLQQIVLIFRKNVSSTGWNETVIENLNVELNRQMDRLETALEEITQKENFTWPNTTMLHLNKYYSRIVRYLKAKLYSRCAWTTVQAEILQNFSYLMALADNLQD